MQNEETFADRLHAAMEREGVKQADIIRLAAQQGVKLGKSHISQYVNGKTVPRAELLRFLAATLRVDADWLAGYDGPVEAASEGGAARTDEGKQKLYSGGEESMREFKKSTKLNDVLYDVRGPVVDEATRMEQSGMDVLKLNIGNPAPFGFRTPDEVIYDMRTQLSDCEG